MRAERLTNINPWPDFEALCRLGGRLSGTPSEAAARSMLADRLRVLADRHGGRFRAVPLPYDGWRPLGGTLRVETVPQLFETYPLLQSPATPAGGLTAEVLDLGPGREADFARRSGALRGRIALVRHEFMFAADHVHRARKYGWAAAGGAAGFLIALTGDLPGPAGGGAGFDDAPPLPSAGICSDAAAAIASAEGARARLSLDVRSGPAETETLLLEFPGEKPEWVVLSAHLDGHDLAESAIDNASGVAAALAAAEAACGGGLRRGLRLCLFSIEEWGLLGSEAYVAGLNDRERREIVLNVNLDSVAGAPNLAALYSGFPRLAEFLEGVAGECGIPLTLMEPLVRNSDHYPFAVAGIPACRLLAGFDRPDSNMRYVLTKGDTRDKVSPEDLRRAARLAAQIVRAACAAEELDLGGA